MTTLTETTIDGFAALTLRNPHVAVVVVPALGARVVSLRAVGAKREWMWGPGDNRGLFACSSDTRFDDSPIAGLDECIPSVLPCRVDGLAIPDHGEAWSRAWALEASASETAPEIVTSLELRTRPFHFRRRISLEANSVRFDYTLRNLSARSVAYLWAMHPLFTLERTDEIHLGGTSDVRITETKGSRLRAGDTGAWPSMGNRARLDRADLGDISEADLDNGYLKGFLATAKASTFSLVDTIHDERLALDVDPAEVAAWGYWVSQGGWNGHRHIALEPTNAAANGLDELTAGPVAHTLAPHETRQWRVALTLEANVGR